MTFKFIHTADWQIGKRFGAFDDETAARLRAARISVIERIAHAARAHGAGHVLVAGDIFDREDAENSVYQQPIAKLKSFKDIIWHLIPGNHDSARSGVWEQIVQNDPGSNVRIYLEPGAHEITDGVALLVAPLMARTASADPTGWMDGDDLFRSETGGGVRIGLAHGSVADFGAEASVLIDQNRAQSAKLDYLALGDWHGQKEINSRTYYSGTPETDGWMQNDPGYVLAVEVDGQAKSLNVEKIPVGQYVWHERKIELSGDFNPALVTDGLDELAPQPDHLLLKFRLEGLVSPEGYGQLSELLDRLGASFGAVQRNEKRLETRSLASDLDGLKADPTLHLTATRLSDKIAGSSDDEKSTSQNALKRLYAYVARLDDGSDVVDDGGRS